jgi:hypothetical protein
VAVSPGVQVGQRTTGGILRGMSQGDTTTIKVPKQLRERIAREAAGRGLTAAALITLLLDDRDRARRFQGVRDSYAVPDLDYRDEVEAWDATSADGLDT